MSGQVGSNRKVGSAVPLDVSVVDASGAQITSFGGGSGGTSATDDGAFTIGGASSITPVGYLADETAPDSVDEGDVGIARMTLNRLALTVISDASTEKRVGVVDLATRDALAVAIVDAGGDQITSFGGGTQYTEDAAAAANPVGTALILVREDARAGGLTTTDGDNVAARGNDKGELYVKHTDAIPVTDNSGSITVDNNGTFAVQATIAAGATNIAKAEDAAHSSSDVGVMLLAVREATSVDLSAGNTDGDYEPLQVDALGRLHTAGKELPDATSTFAPTNVTSTANEASHVLKNAPGVLYSITGYNAKTSSQFIQLHNTTSVPADTAVPVITFIVPASSNFSLDFGGKFGRYFSTGISICNSSTQQTKTVGTTDCWFDAQIT